MHCPRCGQQQVSDQVKFCSRCGFLLELIPELLANGGIFPQLAELQKGKKGLTRKKVLKFGLVTWILMWFVVAPLGAMADVDEIAGLGGILGFATLILTPIIAFVFLDKEPDPSKMPGVGFRADYMPQNLGAGAPQGALPPQQSVPASAYVPPHQPQPQHAPGRWQTTNDLTPPPGSVTEQTTKLLEKDK